MSEMITAERIAWNGRVFRDVKGLADDLSFRRVLTENFSTDHAPFPRGRIRRIIHDRQFFGLLDQAIQTVNTMDPVAFSAGVTPRIAEDESSKQLSKMKDFEQVEWRARLAVFRTLLMNPDFEQLVREHADKWPWILRFMEVGKSLPKRTTQDEPRPAERGVGHSLQNIFSPLMQSAMWVAPIALGAGLVATLIVEKQSEERLLQPITISQTDPKIDQIWETVNRILPATDAVLVRTNQIADSLPKIDEISTNAKQITNEVERIPGQEETTRTSIDTVVNDRADGIVNQISMIESRGLNATLTVDNTVLAKLDGAFKNFGQLNFTAPPEGFTVLLGNAAAHPLAAESDGKTAGQAFRLNLSDSDLNLHQDIYPVQRTSPIETSSPQPPFLVAFEPARNAIKVPSIVGTQTGWEKASLELCNEAMPYKIVLWRGPEDPTGAACLSGDTDAQRLLTVTKTLQYVKEIHAYLSVDAFSGRAYWLFGGRRVVLQIAPARPEQSTPSSQADKLPGVSLVNKAEAAR